MVLIFFLHKSKNVRSQLSVLGAFNFGNRSAKTVESDSKLPRDKRLKQNRFQYYLDCNTNVSVNDKEKIIMCSSVMPAQNK